MDMAASDGKEDLAKTKSEEYMLSSAIYQGAPMSKQYKSSLSIEVPKDLDKGREDATENIGTLEKPFEPDEGSYGEQSFSFDKIRQLPTPILSNGSFSYSPPQSQRLEIRKRRGPEKEQLKSLRTNSEYMPILASSQKLEDNLEASNEKRFISSPGRDVSVGDELVSSNSSIPEGDLSKHKGQLFYAPRHKKTYKYESQVGSGNYSIVVLARNIDDASDVLSVKIISVPSERRELLNFRGFILRELNILYHLNHPCIIKLLDYNLSLKITNEEIEMDLIDETGSEPESDGNPLDSDFKDSKLNTDQQVFLNYCPGGDFLRFLSTHFKSNTKKNSFWSLMQRVVAELVVAVAYLHSHSIVHRDIKLENILLNLTLKDIFDIKDFDTTLERPVINLTDFGLSKRLEYPGQLLTTRCGSQDYISPELLMGLKYDGKLTDAWSIGVLIYSLLENRLPFDPPPISQLSTLIISPSVLRRRRARNNVAHRIAMIDWDWFEINSLLEDTCLNSCSKTIIRNLQMTVELLLVRKDQRLTPQDFLDNEKGSWIKHIIPKKFYADLAARTDF